MTLGVLITYYNERELLTECLESLRRQTTPVDEILIYDDASDHPATRYVPEGLPVRVIRFETNRGPASGRNVLLQESRSDCIHFHDSDDLFQAHWSSQVRKAFGDAGVEAVFTEISFCAEDGALRDERVLNLKALEREDDAVRFCLRECLLTPSGTYRRSAVVRIGGYRESLWQSEDWDFHVRLAASGITYCVVDEVLVLCRSRSTSRSRNRTENFTWAVQAAELLSRELPRTYWSDLSEKAALFGSTLFQLQAPDEARAAFRLAARLGPPRFSGRRRLYRMLARTFGPEMAEWTGAWYRRVIPRALRRGLPERSMREPALPPDAEATVSH